MSHPRRVVPDTVYLLTRRAYQRTHRLRPHPLTNQIAEYCVAWAALKTGVALHAFVLMSNHHHLVVSDPRGVLPEFLRELHRTMSKALNSAHQQTENLWAAEPASAVRLPTLLDLLDKIAYCAANPVAAALVASPEQWPGVNLWMPGTTKRVRRPNVYFDPHGDMPPVVDLTLEPPPAALAKQGAASVEEWCARVSKAVATKVAEARASVAKQGLRFMGAAAAMRISILARATSHEAKRRINPVLAARDVKIRQACLQVERAFRSAYRSALAAWKAGIREVAFPHGTWWMGVHHAATVSMS